MSFFLLQEEGRATAYLDTITFQKLRTAVQDELLIKYVVSICDDDTDVDAEARCSR